MTDKDLERYAAQAAIPLLYVQSRLSDFGPDVQAAVAENATVDFFLHGPPGRGKTRLSAAILLQSIQGGFAWHEDKSFVRPVHTLSAALGMSPTFSAKSSSPSAGMDRAKRSFCAGSAAIARW